MIRLHHADQPGELTRETASIARYEELEAIPPASGSRGCYPAGEDAMMLRRPSDALIGRLAASFIACVSLVYWASFSHGALSALSYDSFRYLGGAESIASHSLYLDLDGTPQHTWPPGTSLLYAGASRVTGRSAEKLVPAINLIALLVTLFAFWRILELTRVRWWISAIVFAALALNGVFLGEMTKLWSDPIALALFVTMLCCLMTESFVAANVIVAIAVVFRFAMVAALPVLLIAALMSRRRRWMPFVTGAVILLFVLSTRGRGGAMQPLHLHANWNAFCELAAQMVPSVLVVIAVTIAIPLLVARRVSAVLLAMTWIISYISFLIIAQALATPSFTTDLRILFPLYPAMLLSAAAAAESARRRPVAIGLTLVVAIGALRGAHYVVGSLRSQPAAQRCITREALVEQIRKAAGTAPSVATNAQGLVWYALRRPTYRLGRSTPPGDALILWIDPEVACPSSIDDNDAPRRGTVIGAGSRGRV
jgi:hypothetical protein